MWEAVLKTGLYLGRFSRPELSLNGEYCNTPIRVVTGANTVERDQSR